MVVVVQPENRVEPVFFGTTDTLCLPSTAVLAPTDPKLLKNGSTATADTSGNC